MERRFGFQNSLNNIKGEIEKRLEQFVEYPGSKEGNEWYLTSWFGAKLIPSELSKVEEKTKK